LGFLGRDPDVRVTSKSGKVVHLAVATSESWIDKRSGERQERTEWHRVVIFNEVLVDVAEQYLHKGSRVYLEGALQTRKWADQAGVEHYTTEIVLSQVNGKLVSLSRNGEPKSEA
jgi:single-strand DNA-binding protein